MVKNNGKGFSTDTKPYSNGTVTVNGTVTAIGTVTVQIIACSKKVN